MSSDHLQQLVYQARLAEQAERYDEMSEFMKEVAVSSDKDLNLEERNLLSVAFKNAVGARRASLRIINSVEMKQTKKGNVENASLARKYRTMVEEELNTICYDILSVIDDNLLKRIEDDQKTEGVVESIVFYYKMKGDYYRYLSEFRPEKNSEHIEQARSSYDKAFKEAVALPPTHAIRLGLALNYSVFHFEILQSPEDACRMAQKAFDEAIAELDHVSEESYRDSTLIMQLLRDNLTLWNSDSTQAKETDGA